MMSLSIQEILGGLLTISVRVSGLLLFAPFFGSVAIPARVKAGLVFALTLLLYPTVSKGLYVAKASEWPALVISELLIGAALGIATNIVFDAVQMAGQVLSVQMGYSLVNILDPQTQVESTVMALFHQTIAMLIFLRLDVHFWLLRAIGRSFQALPPGSAHISNAFTVAALRAGGSVFEIGVQIAAPVLSATLITDIILGLLGKAAPQAPLMLLGPAVKGILGLLVMMVTLRYWPTLFERLFLHSMEYADRLLLLAR